jgi:signal transduction histidine kinase
VGTVEERSRTRLLLTAVMVIAPLASTELWADLGFPVPRLGAVGIFTFTTLLMTAALRFRLFDRALNPSNVLSATILAGVGGIAYLTVFHLAGSNTALLVLGTLTVTITLLAASRLVFGAMIARRDHTVRYVTLGKMAAQMAHDLKNPLAAMKGACQFLREERVQGRSIDDRVEFLDLLVSQIDRLENAIDKYQRLRDMQPTSWSERSSRCAASTTACGSPSRRSWPTSCRCVRRIVTCSRARSRTSCRTRSRPTRRMQL